MITLKGITLIRELTDNSRSTNDFVEYCNLLEMKDDEELSAPVHVANAQDAWVNILRHKSKVSVGRKMYCLNWMKFFAMLWKSKLL